MANGFRENGPSPEGTVTQFNGVTFRFWGPGREGIAVDGSRDNRIAGNWIVGNAAGGVFLYTNCGENVHSDPANWVEHRFGAEDNTVVSNLITGGETGVWIGSRMGENVFPMDCSDVPYVSGPARAITLDRAPRTTVRNNVIGDATYGVRVEDDGARIVGNVICGPRRRASRDHRRDAVPHDGAGPPGHGHDRPRQRVDDRRQPEPLPVGRRCARARRPPEHRTRRAFGVLSRLPTCRGGRS